MSNFVFPGLEYLKMSVLKMSTDKSNFHFRDCVNSLQSKKLMIKKATHIIWAELFTLVSMNQKYSCDIAVILQYYHM